LESGQINSFIFLEREKGRKGKGDKNLKRKFLLVLKTLIKRDKIRNLKK